MPILEMKKKFIFNKAVNPNLHISGNITDGELSVYLTRSVYTMTDVVLLHRRDIELLLPILKELLEVS